MLEARFAQLLNFEQGRLRASIPTTIAPRYGDPCQAGLQPQRIPLVSADARYPLSLKLTIGPALAGARIECPTHPFALSGGGVVGATGFELAPHHGRFKWHGNLAGKAEALALALKYQLMSEHTHCILVHRRADADKATEPAELHRVRSMLAAGWGGLGSSRLSESGYGIGAATLFCTQSSPPWENEDPECLSQEAIARTVADHFAKSGRLEGLSARFEGEPMFSSIQVAIQKAGLLGLSLDQTFLLLAHWANTRPDGLDDADLARMFEPFVSAIDPAIAQAGMSALSVSLDLYSVDSWI